MTGVTDPEEIERRHFLDALSLLAIEHVANAGRIADVGSGAGLPALVLALALPDAQIIAVESQAKKCVYLERTSVALGLSNLGVCCQRAE